MAPTSPNFVRQKSSCDNLGVGHLSVNLMSGKYFSFYRKVIPDRWLVQCTVLNAIRVLRTRKNHHITTTSGQKSHPVLSFPPFSSETLLYGYFRPIFRPNFLITYVFSGVICDSSWVEIEEHFGFRTQVRTVVSREGLPDGGERYNTIGSDEWLVVGVLGGIPEIQKADHEETWSFGKSKVQATYGTLMGGSVNNQPKLHRCYKDMVTLPHESCTVNLAPSYELTFVHEGSEVILLREVHKTHVEVKQTERSLTNLCQLLVFLLVQYDALPRVRPDVAVLGHGACRAATRIMTCQCTDIWLLAGTITLYFFL